MKEELLSLVLLGESTPSARGWPRCRCRSCPAAAPSPLTVVLCHRPPSSPPLTKLATAPPIERRRLPPSAGDHFPPDIWPRSTRHHRQDAARVGQAGHDGCHPRPPTRNPKGFAASTLTPAAGVRPPTTPPRRPTPPPLACPPQP